MLALASAGWVGYFIPLAVVTGFGLRMMGLPKAQSADGNGGYSSVG